MVDAFTRMRSTARRMIRKALGGLGYEIRRVTAETATPDLWAWLRQSRRIATVIDIGANTGEFAAFLVEFFRPRATYLFEPLPACLPVLRERATAFPGGRLFDVALSDECGEATFYVNSYAPSSSLLRVGALHRREFPATTGETPVRVRLARLDDILDPSSLEREIFIKIDVQGVEDKVIRGGRAVFSAACYVMIEMSFLPLYESQALFHEVHSLLDTLGFRFAGIKNQVNSPDSGQPLFAHCLYVRDPGAESLGAEPR